VHAHWASELKLDYDDPTSKTVGAELVATSITTGGNGADSNPVSHPFLAINPHLKFYNNQRGYVLTSIDREEMKADFKVLAQVATPGAAVYTKATYVIEDGVAGLNQTYLRPYQPASTLAAKSGDQVIRETVDQETRRP
jgi:alkaline phosphatase D